MPIATRGTFTCPCCAADITITVTQSGRLVANVEFLIRKNEEEAPTERPGLVRPDELSTRIYENVHGQEASERPTKAKFDRNKYQRELMRKRRGKHSEGITGKEPG